MSINAAGDYLLLMKNVYCYLPFEFCSAFILLI